MGGSQCPLRRRLLDGRAQETGIRRIGTDSTLLQILNAHNDVVRSDLPEAVGGTEWVRLIDTTLSEGDGLGGSTATSTT